jgi:hypothetical protein
MPAHNPGDRTIVAKIAAAQRWGNCPDRTAATAPARAGLRARFEREAQANADHLLTPVELAKRVDSLQAAHMARMSLRAAQARRQRATRAVA